MGDQSANQGEDQDCVLSRRVSDFQEHFGIFLDRMPKTLADWEKSPFARLSAGDVDFSRVSAKESLADKARDNDTDVVLILGEKALNISVDNCSFSVEIANSINLQKNV